MARDRARGCAGIAAAVGRRPLPAPMAYPAGLGRWPAAAGILAFAWIELVYSGRTDPSHLAVLALVYAAVQLVGMSLYGIESWNRYGDGFGVYFGLFARMSPLRWTRGALYGRMPLSGLTTLDPVPGTVALLCTMIGTTSFDGFSAGPTWGEIAPRMTDSLRNIGFSQATALEIAYTLGLIVVVALMAGLYRLGVLGMRSVGGSDLTTDQLAARFAHTLVPIALAYVVAHYFSLLAYQGQAMFYLVSDPLGNGRDIFGTAKTTIDYTLDLGQRHLVRPGRRARARARRRPGPGARPRAHHVQGRARRDPFAILDARRDDRLHLPRPVAAVGGQRMTLPLAHAGHWLVNVLYLVPLLIVVAMLAISSIRDRRAEAAEIAAAGPPAAPSLDADAPRDEP